MSPVMSRRFTARGALADERNSFTWVADKKELFENYSFSFSFVFKCIAWDFTGANHKQKCFCLTGFPFCQNLTYYYIKLCSIIYL